MNDNQTVRELVDIYKRMELGNVCRETRALIAYITDLFVGEHGDKKLADMRAIDLLAFIKDHPDWKSASTQKRHISVIKRVFNWCVEMELITRNPFLRTRYRGDAPVRRKPMTDEEFQALMRVCDPVFRRFLTFLKFTGCRPGEAAGMKWKDVRFDQASVVLKDHKTAKKTGRPRVIPLVPALIRMLVWIRKNRQASVIGLVERALLDHGGRMKAVELFRRMRPYGISVNGVRRARLALGIIRTREKGKTDGCWFYELPRGHEKLPKESPSDGDFVFIGCLGNPFNRRALVTRVQRARRRAGLPEHVTLYGLRHRYGLVGIKNGVNLKLLSLCMGHTRTQMTEHYIHEAGLTDQVQQAALQVAFGAGAVAVAAPPPRPVVVIVPPPAESIEPVTVHIPSRAGNARPQVPLQPAPLEGPMTGAKTEVLLQQILQRLNQPKPPKKKRTAESVPAPLKPAEANAWQAYQWAIAQKPALAPLKDKELYDWLLEHKDSLPAKLPPQFPTFARYLAAARLFHNQRKRNLYPRRPA